MNESDDHIDSDGDTYNAETPLETLEQSLAGRVAAALAVLAEAQAEAEKAGPGAVARVVALYGDRFASAMEDFGEALADALGSSPAMLDLGPLLAMSRDLPVFRRAQQVVAKKEADPELQMVLLRGRGAAFDAPSLLLDRYYQESVSARSLRSRAAALGELLTEEVCARVARGQNEVRLLHLQSGSLAELDAVLDHPVCSAHLAITFVDGSTPALRGSRQRVASRLTIKPTFLRAEPRTFAEGSNRPPHAFDLVLTFTLFDMLSSAAALSLLRTSFGLLRPDGALLTSGYYPSVPRSEKALTLGMLGAHVNYWDEEAWRKLLARASFDNERVHFKRYAPAAIIVIARRG